MLSTRHSLRTMRRMLCGGAEPAAGCTVGTMRHQLRYASRHDCRPPSRELLSVGAAAAPAAEAAQRTAAAHRLCWQPCARCGCRPGGVRSARPLQLSACWCKSRACGAPELPSRGHSAEQTVLAHIFAGLGCRRMRAGQHDACWEPNQVGAM